MDLAAALAIIAVLAVVVGGILGILWFRAGAGVVGARVCAVKDVASGAGAAIPAGSVGIVVGFASGRMLVKWSGRGPRGMHTDPSSVCKLPLVLHCSGHAALDGAYTYADGLGSCNGWPAWRYSGEVPRWLYRTPGGRWAVTQDLADMRRGGGCAFAIDRDGRLPPRQVAGRWRLADGKDVEVCFGDKPGRECSQSEQLQSCPESALFKEQPAPKATTPSTPSTPPTAPLRRGASRESASSAKRPSRARPSVEMPLAARFPAGTWVITRGLAKRALNGKRVRVTGTQSDRVVVLFDSQQSAVRPENVTKAPWRKGEKYREGKLPAEAQYSAKLKSWVEELSSEGE
eukprot:TRINITY_DN8865_c3_g1_i1.p1 TRINITY_DN8865_c3_g1~~TRINITY_DN8865_c3_g1_i1.p1  ORF type:complete len:383 (+),score=32.76 TRINITY_DN8865_c3_g1_i1:117-1151(+)